MFCSIGIHCPQLLIVIVIVNSIVMQTQFGSYIPMQFLEVYYNFFRSKSKNIYIT